MTARKDLLELLGQDVVVHGDGTVELVRGRLLGLIDAPSAVVLTEDGEKVCMPQDYQFAPDLTADARQVIAQIERYEDEHSQHGDGWPCLVEALIAARSAVRR